MLSLKEFQRKCICIKKMRDEDEFDGIMRDLLAEHEDKRLMDEWNQVRKAQLEFGEEYAPITVIGTVMGIKMETCPCCKTTITKEICPCCKETLKRDVIKRDEDYEYYIVYCSHCEYRYAKAKRLTKH